MWFNLYEIFHRFHEQIILVLTVVLAKQPEERFPKTPKLSFELSGLLSGLLFPGICLDPMPVRDSWLVIQESTAINECYIYICVDIHIMINACIHVYVYMCMYTCIRILYMYTVYVCNYVYIYIYISYICIHIHTYTYYYNYYYYYYYHYYYYCEMRTQEFCATRFEAATNDCSCLFFSWHVAAVTAAASLKHREPRLQQVRQPPVLAWQHLIDSWSKDRHQIDTQKTCHNCGPNYGCSTFISVIPASGITHCDPIIYY